MKITKHESLIYVDVDDTLIHTATSKYDEIVDYYGTPRRIIYNHKHIELLKAYKKRGAYIIVHSGNGWQWALNVIKALKLESYVDEIKSKGIKYVDDVPYDQFSQRIYLGEEHGFKIDRK